MLLQSTRGIDSDTFGRFNRHPETARRNRRVDAQAHSLATALRSSQGASRFTQVRPTRSFGRHGRSSAKAAASNGF